jgi:hypothetical protein
MIMVPSLARTEPAGANSGATSFRWQRCQLQATLTQDAAHRPRQDAVQRMAALKGHVAQAGTGSRTFCRHNLMSSTLAI